MRFETVWDGEEKLIIAMDFGATMTGVAYAHLYPQGFPQVVEVKEWPGQEDDGISAKVPTIAWYDNSGNAKAFCAEARNEDHFEAREKGWTLAKYFKLHLHPTTMRSDHPIVLEPLPPHVTIDQIYSDLFRYVYGHTMQFFQNHQTGGEELWRRLKQRKKIEFVIAHPNGWTLHEQQFLRKAAVRGGLVAEGDSTSLVHMITEGEASVHFVLHHRAARNNVQLGNSFESLILCDAGGSTVDTTFYEITRLSPATLREKRASACIQAGGIYVNQEAKKFLAPRLSIAKLAESDVQHVIDLFEKEKRKFSDPDQSGMRFRVGPVNMHCPSIGLSRGMLTIAGPQVAQFFFRIEDIVASIKEQMGDDTVKNLFLVGGFGDSPYLRRELRRCLPSHIEITSASETGAKAVANGAAAWYIRRLVTARATRFAYGIITTFPYDSSDWRHIGRKVHQDMSGDNVHGRWGEIAAKSVAFELNGLRREAYSYAYPTRSPLLRTFSARLLVYTGLETPPYFAEDDSGNLTNNFIRACVIEADLSNISGDLKQVLGPRGIYWRLEFEVGIQFGATELAAFIIWKDPRGNECRGKATVIPNQFT